MVQVMFLYTILFFSFVISQKRLHEKFKWNSLEFEFDSPEEKNFAIESGAFIKGNSLIMAIERWNDKLFLAVPRFKNGVPSTLNYINLEGVDTKSPKLIPYPSWEMNAIYNKTNSKKLISVVSLSIDNCNRLWVFDSGMINEFGIKKIEASPSILVFQLNNNILLRKYTLNDNQFNSESKFRQIVADVPSGNCEFSYAYIADSNQGLIVYNWELNKSHKIKHNYFSFEPLWGNFITSSGTSIQLSDGIMALALAPTRDGARKLLFHSLVGVNEYSVSTQVLQNKTTGNIRLDFLGERGQNSQSSSSIMDGVTGVLFYTLITKNGIGCWNSQRGKRFSVMDQDIIDTFDDNVAFPNDLKIDNNGTLWILTNHLLDFEYEKLHNVMLTVYTGRVNDLIQNTKCTEL